MPPETAPVLREAVAADVPALAKHRRRMFEEMLAAQPVSYTSADVEAMGPAYERYLHEQFGKAVRAWVADAGGGLAASGAILFYNWAPRPGDLTGQAALLHSIYTEPEYRRMGLARRITEQMVAFCAAAGYKTVALHASQAGRPLYEALGFRPTSEMRLTL